MSIKRYLRGIRDKMPPGYVLGRASKGDGPVELIKVAGLAVPGGAGGNSNIPVAPPGSSGTVATVPVTNAELADMAPWTIKARNDAASGDPQDVAMADFTTATPAATDFLVGFLSTGELRKFNASVVGTSYVPLSMGTEPLTFVSNGSGQPILVPYTP